MPHEAIIGATIPIRDAGRIYAEIAWKIGKNFTLKVKKNIFVQKRVLEKDVMYGKNKRNVSIILITECQNIIQAVIHGYIKVHLLCKKVLAEL